MPDFADSLHGDLGDRYMVERELGHGATATVYLARDSKHDRLVALKVLSPDLALAVPTERFLREIRTTAKLSHPHIVPLFDSGSAGGRPFYVMPYIRGEALRDRLARGGPLSVGEALRIARQVAGALDHAHRHGVIHRDIKPGNILLEEGHAWVADFGIARAIAATASESVTQTGVTIGTPAYMSPEQAMGDAHLDARSDVYSLGCVLYEMLTGTLPFNGPDIQSVLNKHLVEPLPSVRGLRPEIPVQVEMLLDVALAKKREDRFATAAEFAQALSLEGAGPLTPTRTQPVKARRRVRVRPWAMGGVGGAFAVAAVFVVWKLAFGGDRTLDPTAYFVAPFSRAEGVPGALDAGRLLQDALNQWSGIKVLGRFEAPSDQGPVDGARARALARDSRAGHYVRGEVSPVGDSIRVRAALYATTDGSLVRERAINLGASLRGADSLFAGLADRVLFDDTVVAANGGRAGTRSVAARQAFARGLAAVQQWELVAADSAFRQASEHDPGYAQAHLWVAQVRFWGDAAPATWRSSAERAATGRNRLSLRDQVLSNALLTLGRGDTVRACAAWDRLTQQEAADFVGWYGLANCLGRDDTVIRDPTSPSGWRFRTSYHRITRAYQQGFQLLPSIHKSLRGRSYEFVRRLLMTSGSMFRFGHAPPPDSARFAAYPSWRGDTLTLVPYPLRVFGGPHEIPETRSIAVRRERELFHDIATAWVTAFPNSADAVEALAISLDMLGDATAIDTLQRARSLVITPEERLRVAGAEVWMRARFSIPHDLAGVRAARALADSLLGAYTSPKTPEPLLLASLAALTGRPHLAAALTRRPAVVEEWGIPAPLAAAGGPLLVFAAFGGPVDSLVALEAQVESAIDRALVLAAGQAARMQWLGRPAQLAFPAYRFASLPRLAGGGDYMLDAQAALLRGDTIAVQRMFDDLQATRRFSSPGDLTPDALYPESWLLAALGDPKAAIRWLDPTLAALSTTAPEKLVDPANAGALVQAMALRAELADKLGDAPTAARWARVVAALWGGADAFLEPRVHRMQRLAANAP